MEPHPRYRKTVIQGRLAVRVALLLLLGAAASIGVAWACACWWSPTLQYGSSISSDRIALWPWTPPSEWPQVNLYTHWSGSFGASLRRWKHRPPAQTSPDYIDLPSDCIMSQMGAGWPMLALESRWMAGPSVPVGHERMSWRGGLLVRRDGVEISIPVRPIWSGLLLDTLFYASLAGAVIIGPRTVRCAIRRRRGLCLKCGYDPRGLAIGAACPECGAPTPPVPQRT